MYMAEVDFSVQCFLYFRICGMSRFSAIQMHCSVMWSRFFKATSLCKTKLFPVIYEEELTIRKMD
jgi:hypothetical protein